MKLFKFRLQSVLEQRERRENQAVQDYAQAKQAVKDAESILSDLIQLRWDLINGLSELRKSGNIDPREQVVYQDYIKQAKLGIDRQEDYIAELTTLADKMRIHLVDASQDKQVIDKMKVKSVEQHRYETMRQEQEESDELSTLRHQFKQGMDRAA